MGKNPHCTCTICNTEKRIELELALPEAHQTYLQIAAAKPVLLGFPTVLHLVASIHGCRNTEDGAAFSDLIFAQLLSGTIVADHWHFLEKVLLLVFMPTAHAAVRQVSHRYQFLAREDISQVALTTLIQCLRSRSWRAQRSHFGFTLARKLRGCLFRWARREFQSTSQFASQQIGNGLSVTQTAEESFERHAILRHFLTLCQQRAYLTVDELNLLIDLKLEETLTNGLSDHRVRASNSFRQRVKRLMTKLRRLARTPANIREHNGRSRN